MSDYKRMKVLRLPFEYANIGSVDDYDDISHDLWDKYGDIFYWNGTNIGKFNYAPTERPFIDFVLESEYGADSGEWGKVRELYPQEIDKYKEVFKKLSANIDMSKVKLVEYCWYNCSEAPDYYDPAEDTFYNEIPFICNFTLN
jgi:hypothetical protein